jgi:hypothetical protein
VADAAEVVVFLERHFVFLGWRHRHPSFRDEFEFRKAIPRIVDDRIEDDIETQESPTAAISYKVSRSRMSVLRISGIELWRRAWPLWHALLRTCS